MKTMGKIKYKKKPDIVTHQDIDGIYILGETEDEIVFLNKTANFILQSFSKPSTTGKIRDLFAQKYHGSVQESTLKKDAQTIISGLIAKKIIIPV